MAGGGDLSRAWWLLMQRRQTKARLYFPLPDRDKLLCRSRPLILGMSKSTTKQPVRLSSGEHKNSSPDENAWATNPIERIKTLIAFPTALSSSTMATIGPLFGTWQDR